MPINMNMNVDLTNLIKRARLKDLMEAEQRLKTRFGQEGAFGTPMQPTAQDLTDYQRVSGTDWPKRPMTIGELQRMQVDMGGGSAAVNVPTETVAEPISQSDRQMMDAIDKQRIANVTGTMQDEAKAAQWTDKYKRLSSFLGNGWSRDDVLSNMGMKRADRSPDADTWGAPYAGPDGSLLQRSVRGKVASVLGRRPADKEPQDDRLKIEQKFRNLALRQYGASDLASLDPALAVKVNAVSDLATQNYLGNPDEGYNRAFNAAWDSVQGEQAVLFKLPRPNRGWFSDNSEDAAKAVRSALEFGISPDAISRAMLEKGWKIEELKKLVNMEMKRPGVVSSAGGSSISSAGGGKSSSDPLGIR